MNSNTSTMLPTANEEQRLKNVTPKLGTQLESLRCSVIALVILALLLVIPLTALIIGEMSRFSCPSSTSVPEWLIVYGAVFLVACLLTAVLIMIRCIYLYERRERMNCIIILVDTLFAMFFFAWLIYGLSKNAFNLSFSENISYTCRVSFGFYIGLTAISALMTLPAVICCCYICFHKA